MRFVYSLSQTRATFIHKRHRFRAAHVPGLEPIELKAGALDQRFDRAVEMAAAAQALPDRGQPILPPNDVWIRRATVLDKQQMPTGSEHPTHLAERSQGVGNAAQGPSRHDGVDARVLERNSFSRTLDKFYQPEADALNSARHFQEPRRGFEADHPRHVARIERKVES